MDKRIDEAMKFAARAHDGQTRKVNSTPYISHPYAVAWILREAGATEDEIIAGLLHDVIEDTNIKLGEIRLYFGSEVAHLVEQCTELDRNVPWRSRKEDTHSILKTASESVKLITCADKLHNLNSIYADMQIYGDAVWQKFEKGKEDQAWYYGTIAEIICADRVEGVYPFADFRKIVGLLFG